MHRDHDAEEVRLGERHALVELEASFAERQADGLRLDDAAEFAAHGLLGVGGDHLEIVEQRQAGLDAAHDHVDGVGKDVEKARFPPLLEERQQPKGQPAAGGEGKADRRQQAGAGRQHQHERANAESAGGQQEAAGRPGQSRLSDAYGEWHALCGPLA